ncbi:hypothetical protein SK571_45560 [Lentzea sp. BCCO 10_0798]|uniref:Uncharacterized protein n=1 Tax=Lentzea kristufekii TaxID=3095430 RepID=A0ABU4U7Y0_9PSEU|nr:hypothetical protein [Lentzea sp. BCCO 10_0798]MDX8056680.1 hypothetical protein [Lentzea sp. BCCO 10_0798]
MTAARQFIADEVVHTDTDSVHTVVPSRDEAATARLSWEVAVDQLVRPGLHVVRRANGTTETAEVLTLLRQVEEAVLPGSAVSGRPSQGSRPPASLGALSLLASIRREVRQCCRTHGHTAWATLAEQVQAWGEHAGYWQHAAPDYVVWAAQESTRWVAQARQILDPEPRLPLRGRACPVCRVDVVQAWSDDEGDFVRRPALRIDAEQVEAVCAACGQRWGLDVWAQLNTMLDQQLAHETLAVTGITHGDSSA